MYVPGYKGSDYYGTTVALMAAGGEINDVRATMFDDRVVVSDAAAPLHAGAGCMTDGSTVTCPLAHGADAQRQVVFALGEGDDRLAVDCVVAGADSCPMVSAAG